jgi:N6-adenosine-specific RNA methylase IME4
MFRVIQADPAWDFDSSYTGGKRKSGAKHVYPTMPLHAIQQIPVPAVAAPNAVLGLWVPTALKESHGLTTLRAWGFRYKTTVYWDKMRLGMGAWFRNEVEELLIGVKGDGVAAKPNLDKLMALKSRLHFIEQLMIEGDPFEDLVDEMLIGIKGDPAPFGCQLPNIIHKLPGEHSEKPEEFDRLLETATGVESSRYKLELFARRLKPGWTGIGNAMTGRDIKNDVLRLARIRRCTSWNPMDGIVVRDTDPDHGGGRMGSEHPLCSCYGTLDEHSDAVIDRVMSGRNALMLRTLGDQQRETDGTKS